MNQQLQKRKPPKFQKQYEFHVPALRDTSDLEVIRILKSITLYDLIEEWKSLKDAQFVEFLQQKKEQELHKQQQPRKLKKWDIPTSTKSI